MSLELKTQALRSAEVLDSMQGFVEDQLGLLVPVEQSWQPSDFLPDLTSESWVEDVTELRETGQALPDDVLVTLVGDMITEEALPSYQTMLNRFEGLEDKTGTSLSPWGQWSRAWTAEENRHGDLLNRFLYLLGRVDIRSIEVTIQHLIKNGFDGKMDGDPYKGFIYTAFQERATKVSHANVADLAKKAGNTVLAKICHTIAGDEARHEEAYKRFAGKIFEIDTKGAVLAFKDMMKKTIVMPARLMDDGEEGNIFDKFSTVAQRIGVYTAHDYADIIDHLVKRWKISALPGLMGEAAKAQDYLCTLGERYRKIAARMEEKLAPPAPTTFSWIFGRTV